MNLLTTELVFTNIRGGMPHVFKTKIVCLIFLLSLQTKAQVLFYEECFKGGILTAGVETIGGYSGLCEIDWQPHYVLRQAYAVTYRYGRPRTFGFEVNGTDIAWNSSNQAGPEQIELNPLTDYFATHVEYINDGFNVNSNTLSFEIDLQPFNENRANEGWWGIYVVVMYESEFIDNDICLKHFVANQSQVTPQHYAFELPNYNPEMPVVFAIHSGRLSSAPIDASRIIINGNNIGDIWEPDLLFPPTMSGVHGHFSYRNGEVLAFNGDTANTTFNRHDGTAIINSYLNTSSLVQNISLYRIVENPVGGFNPHPSFVIAYTPSCPVLEPTMERKYSYCLGSSVQLQAALGFDNYSWEPQAGLSNAGISNPVCSATQSGWYRVRMWSDEPDARCEQTIPVFVTVHDPPRAFGARTNFSLCHNATGSIEIDSIGGAGPYTFLLNGIPAQGPPFTGLSAGEYLLAITDANWCMWDSTYTIDQIRVTNAAFTANPTAGESPLNVQFQDQSTQANAWQWQADGVPFSSQQNPFYTLADTGTYTVSLIAYLNDPACADTATVTIRVNPGIHIILPNIFTPNGDGVNDKLVAELFGVSRMSWEVYNRWGNLLHSGADNSGEGYVEIWDGNTAGTMATAGVYNVVLTATGLNGKTEVVKGSVSVVY